LKTFGLPKKERLTRQKDYEAVYRAKKVYSDARLRIYARANGLGYSRIGYAIGKRIGKAFKRNRLKRLVREAFRKNKTKLPRGLDFVVIPRTDGEYTLDEISLSLKKLLEKAEGRSGTPRP
jgi:ribonuclease P protein component